MKITKEISNSREFSSFLEKEREKVLTYLRRNFSAVSEEHIEDLYQDSSIELYTNIKDGKLTELTSSLSTYFIRICINKTLKFLRDKENIVPFSSIGDSGNEDWNDGEVVRENLDDLFMLVDDNSESERIEIEENVQRIVRGLPKQCEQLLWGFYRDGLTMDAMAKMFGYSSPESAKTQKSKCMSKFKDNYLK